MELRRSDLNLVRQRRSPLRYAKRALLWDEHLVLANWLAPSVVLLDLTTDARRRIIVGRVPFFAVTNGGLLLVSGEEGRILTLDDAGSKPALALQTEPFRWLQHDARSGTTWIAVGTPVLDSPTQIDSDPTDLLRSYDRDWKQRDIRCRSRYGISR